MENQTDEQLMLDFGRGDTSAFNVLVNRYKKYILNLAYGFIPDAFQAEDIAQEVFLRVYKSAKTYKVKAKFSTWLTRIAVNLCYDEIRKRKRSRLVSFGSAGYNDDIAQNIPDKSLRPAESFENNETGAGIDKALVQLPEDNRIALIMAFYHRMPYEEIAELLKISVSAVKMRVNRGRFLLKEIYKKMQ